MWFHEGRNPGSVSHVNMRPYNLKATALLLATLLIGLLASFATAYAHEANRNAIVLLIAKGPQGKVLGTGSGFIVNPEGTLITNYHVLVDAASLEAVFEDGRRIPVERIYKVDRVKDFAVLKLADGFYSTLEIGSSEKIKEFDYTSALGYLSENVEEREGAHQGKILQTYGFTLGVLPQADPGFAVIYTSAFFGPGFSGGPLVNQENQVVGIATVEGRSINLALPIHYVTPFLAETTSFPFAELVERDRASKEALYYRGNYALFVLGEPESAVQYFKQALEIDSGFILARYDLASAYIRLGNVPEALEEYTKVIELNPRFPEALSNLGGYYFREGKISEAIALFEKAIAIYPNFIQALSNLGAALNKTGQPRKALVPLQKVIALDPQFGISYFNLGNAYFQLNHWDDALEAYKKAISLGVDFLSLHWNRYEIYFKQENLVEARKELELILQIDPNDEDARQKLDQLPH